jgi:hypothetical protein
MEYLHYLFGALLQKITGEIRPQKTGDKNIKLWQIY